MPRPRLSVPALRCRACPCDGQRVRHHPRRARESPLVTLPEHPGDSGRIFPGGEDSVVIRKILTHLSLPTEVPAPRPRRATCSSTRDLSRPRVAVPVGPPRTGVPLAGGRPSPRPHLPPSTSPRGAAATSPDPPACPLCAASLRSDRRGGYGIGINTPFVGLIFTGSRLSVRPPPQNRDGSGRSKPGYSPFWAQLGTRY